MNQENIKTPPRSLRGKQRGGAQPNLGENLSFSPSCWQFPDNPPGVSGCRSCSHSRQPPCPPRNRNILLSLAPRYSCSGNWLCCWKNFQNQIESNFKENGKSTQHVRSCTFFAAEFLVNILGFHSNNEE